jgi:hypothetical protein
MKFCYIDESGTGNESYAVMVGIIVDALRMRLTKIHWEQLLNALKRIVKRHVDEIHARDFYAGNGPWRDINGEQRAAIIDSIFKWLSKRKHHIVYCAIDKQKFNKEFPKDSRHKDLKTIWRFLGIHLVLCIQKNNQHMAKNKGNTVLIFDNEEREQIRFTDLIMNPPNWTDTYYNRGRNQEELDQIVDAPYFADSKDIPLLQTADFVAYFLRRFTEISNGDEERYNGEKDQVNNWVGKILQRSIYRSSIYPQRGRCSCADLFYQYAPSCIRD